MQRTVQCKRACECSPLLYMLDRQKLSRRGVKTEISSTSSAGISAVKTAEEEEKNDYVGLKKMVLGVG